MARTKQCKDCGKTFPEDRDHFGQFKNVRNGETVIGFRNSCRECMRARSRAHDKAHPEQRAERMKRRVDRGDARPGTYDQGVVRFIRRVLSDSCRYCEADLNGGGEVDHLTPVARGGSSAKGNLTLSCQPCNRAKLSKTLDEFMEWRRERGLPIRSSAPKYERPDKPTTDVQRRTY